MEQQDNNSGAALQTNLSVEPGKNFKQTAVSLSERYAAVTTIEQAFLLDEPPLAKTQGDVKRSLIMHLSALSKFLGLRDTLTNEHIEFIAEKMVSSPDYKWLKPADLKIFIDRIKMGKYGDFFGNMNTISFFQSLDKYMIERGGEIERIRIEEAKRHKEDLKAAVKLNYFINEDGKIEYTEAKKAQIAEEERRKAEIAAETKRKQSVAVENSTMKDDEKQRVKEIMQEWEVPYEEALRLFKVEKNQNKQNKQNND